MFKRQSSCTPKLGTTTGTDNGGTPGISTTPTAADIISAPVTCSQHEKWIANFYCDLCGVPLCRTCKGDHVTQGHPTQLLHELVATNHRRLEQRMLRIRSTLTMLHCKQEDIRSFYLSLDKCRHVLEKVAQQHVEKIHAEKVRILDELEFMEIAQARHSDASGDVLEKCVCDTKKVYNQCLHLLHANAPCTLIQAEQIFKKIDSSMNDNCTLLEKCENMTVPTVTFTAANSNGVNLGHLNLSADAVIARSPGEKSTTKNWWDLPSGEVEEEPVSSTSPETKPRQRSISIIHSYLMEGGGQARASIKSSVRRKGKHSYYGESLFEGLPSEPALQDKAEMFVPVAAGSEKDRIYFPDPLWEITTEGHGKGQINCPNDVAFLSDGTLVVADRDNYRVQLFDPDGNFVTTLGEGRLRPRRIAITPDGAIAVTDSRDESIKVFDVRGTMINSWKKKVVKQPCGIGVNSVGQFVVSDMQEHCISIHHSDGKIVAPSDQDHHLFRSPAYLCINAKDQILVSDNCMGTVCIFDAKGNFQHHIGKSSTDCLTLKYPNGICTDLNGNIFLADWGSHCIMLFEPDGTFIQHVLTRDDGLSYPAGVAISYDGTRLATCEYSEGHSALRMYKLF